MGVCFRGENATGSRAGVSGNIRLCLIEQIKQGSFKLERENYFDAGFHLSELKPWLAAHQKDFLPSRERFFHWGKIPRKVNSQCRVKPYLWLGVKTSQSLLTSVKTLTISLEHLRSGCPPLFPWLYWCPFSQRLFSPSCCPLLLTASWKSNSKFFSYFMTGESFACCDPITKYSPLKLPRDEFCQSKGLCWGAAS